MLEEIPERRLILYSSLPIDGTPEKLETLCSASRVSGAAQASRQRP